MLDSDPSTGCADPISVRIPDETPGQLVGVACVSGSDTRTLRLVAWMLLGPPVYKEPA